MTTRILILIISLLTFTAISAQERGNNRKDDCSKRNISFKNINQENALHQFLVDEDRTGVVELHPFSLDEIGGWENFTNSLSDNPHFSYEYVGMHRSRLFDGVFFRYQQLYRGIPVEDGGFSILMTSGDPQARIIAPCAGCPPSDPCDQISMLSVNIYEDIDIESIAPSANRIQMERSLSTSREAAHIDETKLKVVNNIRGNCNYKLVYEVQYSTRQEGQMIGWVDANTSRLLYKTSRHNNKNAPTADFGIQFMNDQIDGTNTVLQNDRLTAHDMSGVATFNPPFGGLPVAVNFTNQLGNEFNDNQIPESPTTRDWLAADASTDVFQAFWMADQVANIFEVELGIVFEDIHVGFHPTARGAISFDNGTLEGSSYAFGQIDGNSTVEYDVIAHELGHTVIRQFFESDLIEGASLHEGIADMFGTYVESILDVLDWQMGDDMPLIIRDLQTPLNFNCFTNAFGSTSEHDRSEPLGHWFFLCVNGDAVSNIPSMNIDEVIALVYEALPTLGTNPDYPDLMEATIDLAESTYGTCSDEFLTILRAWEQICVPTGHWMAEPNTSCIELNPNIVSVCEESNTITLCRSANTGLNTQGGRWRIIGRNSTSFQSTGGMQGNTQYGGSCLQIYHIPQMPFYPQEITINYFHPDGEVSVNRQISIIDCDGDDPTCGEYYDIQGLIQTNSTNAINAQIQPELISDQSDINPAKLIVFDMFGNRLNLTANQLNNNNYEGQPQIIILTYWDKSGQLIESKKVFIH